MSDRTRCTGDIMLATNSTDVPTARSVLIPSSHSSLVTHHHVPLGMSDGLSFSLAIFQLAFSCIVSVVLWRLTAWQRRYEGLEGRLNDIAARLVDERFRGVAREVA